MSGLLFEASGQFFASHNTPTFEIRAKEFAALAYTRFLLSIRRKGYDWFTSSSSASPGVPRIGRNPPSSLTKPTSLDAWIQMLVGQYPCFDL
jgi:hypothetical protein